MASVRTFRTTKRLAKVLVSLTLLGGVAIFAQQAASASSVGSVTFTTSNQVGSGPNVTWTVGFVATSGLTSGDTITITGPANTVLPAMASAYTVNTTSVATVDSGGGTNSVTITTPASVTVIAGGAVSVVITGVDNPPSTGEPMGGYPNTAFSVSTSKDNSGAVSPAGGINFTQNCGATANCIVPGSPSYFESGDGNMTLDVPASAARTPGDTDWNCFVGQGSFATMAQPTGCNSFSGTPAQPNENADHITADGTDTFVLGAGTTTLSGEVGWVSGQKMDTSQTPQLSTGNNPAKDEYTDVVSYHDEGASGPTSGDIFFYGGAIRSTSNGDASGEVEFDQNKAFATQTTSHGKTTTAYFSTNHIPGDKLLAYDFSGGGGTLTFNVLTWITNTGTCDVATDSPGTGGCWSTPIQVNPDLFTGTTNPGTIAMGDNGINDTQLSTSNLFLEFGINLTQALSLVGCPSFAQQVWQSRTSATFTSNPSDFELVSKPIFACGEIKIIKQTDPRGQGQVFNFSSGGSGALPLPAPSTGAISSGGVACSTTSDGDADSSSDNDSDDPGVAADGTFCLNDTGNTGKTLGSPAAADNNTSNTVDETNIPPGTYSVTEGAPPGSYSFESLTCSADNTSGSSVTPTTSTTVKTATITLAPSGVVTCLYENQLHSGAILITKQGKYVNCNGDTAGTAVDNAASTQVGVCAGDLDSTTDTGSETADGLDDDTAYLGGATFRVTDSSNGTVSGGYPLTTLDSNGQICIGNLSWVTGGTTYKVIETSPPAGYAAPTITTKSVTVDANATCNATTAVVTGTAATVTFTDTPLTNLSVGVAAQLPGATNSSISCVNGTQAAIANSPQPSSGSGDPETLADNNSGNVNNGLPPDTYTCTVTVDP